MMTKANIIATDISQLSTEEIEDTMDDNLVQLNVGKDIRVIVTDNEASIIFDNTVNIYADSKGKVRLSGMVLSALKGQTVYNKVQSSGGVNTACSVPIMNQGSVTGSVYIEASADEIGTVISDIEKSMNWLTLLLCVTVGIISIMFANMLTAPVEALIRKIKSFSENDQKNKIDIKAPGEIGELVDSFNSLMDKISLLEQKRTEFVSNASHELKTPLSSIKLICDSLLESGADNPEMTGEFLNDMNNEVDRLTRIINDLLDLTKMDAASYDTNKTFITSNLKDIITGVVSSLTNIAEKSGVTLNFNSNNDVFVLMEENKIWEAIYNITDNAIKYTQEGGNVNIYLEKENKDAIVTVQDTGIGMANDEIKKIFDRFYRIDKARSRETGGTGLGLSIALSAVKMHGGHIEVQSEEGKGSTFRIFLPTA
ncbi:MAG: HAMP domain-containing sensor histidine kinase [Bacillota bacterium]|nr:HAMP domain-containing sensor histidine kinase [Bacillota bacterium]